MFDLGPLFSESGDDLIGLVAFFVLNVIINLLLINKIFEERRINRHLTRNKGPAGGFWIHVDADVLDDAIMPAVDYRLPGGLSWKELTTVLRTAIQSGGAVGLEVTIYNLTLDPGGSAGALLSNVLVQSLARGGR